MKIKECPSCKEPFPEHLIVPNMEVCYKCLLINAVSDNIKKVKQQGENPNDSKERNDRIENS